MRKNLKLFALLVFIFGSIYYWEQVYKPRMEREQSEEISLIKTMSDLPSEIIFKNFHLSKKDNSYSFVDDSFVISTKKISALVARLQKIKIIRELPTVKSSEYLGEEPIDFRLVYSTTKFDYTFGKLMELNGHFYIKDNKQNKVYIAYDSEDYMGFYRDEKDFFFRKYLRLKAFFLNQGDYLIAQNLEQLLDFSSISKIELISAAGDHRDITSGKAELTRAHSQIQFFGLKRKLDNPVLLGQMFMMMKRGPLELKLYKQGQDQAQWYVKLNTIPYYLRIHHKQVDLFFPPEA